MTIIIIMKIIKQIKKSYVQNLRKVESERPTGCHFQLA